MGSLVILNVGGLSQQWVYQRAPEGQMSDWWAQSYREAGHGRVHLQIGVLIGVFCYLAVGSVGPCLLIFHNLLVNKNGASVLCSVIG